LALFRFRRIKTFSLLTESWAWQESIARNTANNDMMVIFKSIFDKKELHKVKYYFNYLCNYLDCTLFYIKIFNVLCNMLKYLVFIVSLSITYCAISQNIVPASMSSFADNTGASSIDQVWFTPEGTVGTVGKFHKVEIGFKLGEEINQEVENFITKRAKGINPFDPEQIDVSVKLIAPNGKSSNLTPEQYELVRTPAFKNWFGDWENNPKEASKVVGENGEPLKQSHFTNSKFTVFKNKETGFHFGDKSIKGDLSIAKGEDFFEELKEKYTIVIVTHSMQQAARVSNRTAYMHMGELIETGLTKNIFSNPEHAKTQDYITGRIG